MRFCLIGSSHPCYNPRLVREADTLVKAGHDVRVVAPAFSPALTALDERLMASRRWRLEHVDLCPSTGWSKYRSVFIRGRRKLAELGFPVIPLIRVADYASMPALPAMIRLACAEPADWFIAHTQLSLPVAAAAARRQQAFLGFDCEDLLAELGYESPEVIHQIEREYIPLCRYVTVPSEAIANRLREFYPGADYHVLYNVFPLKLAETLQLPSTRPSSRDLKCHWFSQSIGPGRGIEDAIEAIRILGSGVRLYLRGHFVAGYEDVIRERVRRCTVTDLVEFLPLIDHDDLIASLADFDVGLALEQPGNGNTSRTVSNKLFSYLLAGLAVAASDTEGQREVMARLPAAGFLYAAGNPRELAEGLRHWMDDPGALKAAKRAAWQAGRETYCWDVAEEKFLRLFDAAQKSQPNHGNNATGKFLVGIDAANTVHPVDG